MAQNITIAGATYSAVPAIDVHKATGGGTARYMDTSDANATAADILTGKTAYVDGVKVTGTGSGGGGGGYTIGSTAIGDGQELDIASGGSYLIISTVSGDGQVLDILDMDDLTVYDGTVI